MTDLSLMDAAQSWARFGASVVRLAPGSKVPKGSWKWAQTKAADAGEVGYMLDGATGFGVVCGKISGNLEMFEFEGRASELFAPFRARLEEAGLVELWDRIIDGYYETSPTGGIHLFYRVTDGPPAGNTKLARTATGEVTIETRGEGGFVVLAPTDASHHDKVNKPWQALNGTPGKVAAISTAERDALFAVARSFDETPERAPIPNVAERRALAAYDEEQSPGDAFNERGTWDEVFDGTGWEPLHEASGRAYWRRPNSTSRMHHAVTGGDRGDYFVCWSTSVPEFDPERAYSKWRVYAILHHAEDFAAAASALAAKGYGAPKVRRPELVSIDLGSGEIDGSVVLAPNPGTAEASLGSTDDGNAMLLVSQFGDVIRYVADRGRWITWDGKRWQWSERGDRVVQEYAKRVSRRLPERDKDEIKWKTYSLSSKGIGAMISLAKSDPALVIGWDELDARPLELNTPGGIVDLRTGKVHPHDPERLHTQITKHAPDFEADRSEWLRFLETSLPVADEREHVSKMLGYSIQGDPREQVIPFLYGKGGNGKSVLIDTVRTILGDYATKTAPGTLTMSGAGRHLAQFTTMRGKRFIVGTEIGGRDQLNEPVLKDFSGGEPITADEKFGAQMTFSARGTIWLFGNKVPTLADGGDSIKRRMHMIGFVYTVPKEKRDPNLRAKLVSVHGGAVMAWLIEQCVRWHNEGLKAPQSIVDATDEFVDSQNSVTLFAEDCCNLQGDSARPHQVKASDLYSAYRDWCRRMGATAEAVENFSRSMKSEFPGVTNRTPGGSPVFVSGPGGRTRGWRGIELKSEADMQ
ncbi:phage/plasmid primase, P4 family [Saccharopolyspora shandongensis]|uniref:phage/plasmid primase, P4 family n=1 Tax=Saccharopolyspora shandongensis TaxID=418495 RepID=UPI0034030170